MKNRFPIKLILVPLLVWLYAFGGAPDTGWKDQLAAGKQLLAKGFSREAEKAFWSVVELPDLSGDQRLRLVANLNSVALAYGAAGRFTEAEALYRRILSLWLKNQLPRDNYEVTILIGLAEVYERQDQLLKALPLLRRALSIWQTAIGPNDPDIAPIMGSLAGLFYRLHRYAEAELFIERRSLLRRWPGAGNMPTSQPP